MPTARKALLHGHCHQKALVGTAPTIAMLKAAGYEVSEVDSGCCGMAGSFGFEKEHYDLSTKDRQPPPRAGGQSCRRRGRDRRAGYLVPTADRASGGKKGEASGGVVMGRTE